MGDPPPMKVPDFDNFGPSDLGPDDLGGFPGFGMAPTGEKQGKLMEFLKDLESSIPEIEAAAIVSAEGLPIASALPRDVDETRVAAMTAAMLSLGERAAQELMKGELLQVLIKGTDGYLISISCGENAVLTVSASNNVKLGLIFLDMKRTAEKIRNELEG